MITISELRKLHLLIELKLLLFSVSTEKSNKKELVADATPLKIISASLNDFNSLRSNKKSVRALRYDNFLYAPCHRRHEQMLLVW